MMSEPHRRCGLLVILYSDYYSNDDDNDTYCDPEYFCILKLLIYDDGYD